MARTARGLEKKDSSLMFREISPPHGWKDDLQNHYLRLTLPGFEAKDITIHMDKYGHLVVRGNKQVTEHKYICFDETFDVPNDAVLEEADGLFEDNNNQIYCVSIPKKKDGHAISMAQDERRNRPNIEDNKLGPIQNKDSNGKSHGLPLPNNNNNYNYNNNNSLQLIKGNKFKKWIAAFIVLLIALLVVAVVLIIKLRHH